MRPRPLATTEVMSHAGLGQVTTVFLLLWTIAKAVCWFHGGNIVPCRYGIGLLPVGYSDNRPVVTSKAGGLFEAP